MVSGKKHIIKESTKNYLKNIIWRPETKSPETILNYERFPVGKQYFWTGFREFEKGPTQRLTFLFGRFRGGILTKA